MIDKAKLLAALLAQVTADLAALERRQADTAAGATHEESRAEHAKDTRATEQSYLARGLAERVAELVAARDRLTRLEPTHFDAADAIRVGALIELYDATTDASENWWLVPVAGGIELSIDDRIVRTITPAAPLGRSLLGLEAGDDGEFQSPSGPRSFEVRAVR